MVSLTVEPRATAPAVVRRRSSDFAIELASKYTLVALLVVVLAAFTVALPGRFATTTNLQGLSGNQATVAVLALAVIFPLIVGEFDLSVGYSLGLSQALVVGLMSKSHWPIVAAIVGVLVLTTVVGLAVGTIVACTRIPSLVVTLAAGSILGGITYGYTGGNVLYQNVPADYSLIARTKIAEVPLPFVYVLVGAIVAAWVLRRRPVGRHMYAVGGNRVAAGLVGIRTRRMVIGSFGMSGALAGVAGILISSRLNSAQAGLGPDFLLPAFAAAYLGATTIRPGRFNPIGVVVAVYLLAATTNGLELAGVPSWAEQIFNGAALLIAVGISHRVALLRKVRAQRHAANRKPTEPTVEGS